MITIYKSQRMLFVTKGKRTVFTCPVHLGFAPDGHKQAEGDGRTPEGKYRICSVNPDSKFHFAFGISYPNARDARRAWREKRLKPADALFVILANALLLKPKWTTPLGGCIMLHGESPEKKTGDWTQGCVAVSDRDMDTLASLCKRGEKIIIN